MAVKSPRVQQRAQHIQRHGACALATTTSRDKSKKRGCGPVRNAVFLFMASGRDSIWDDERAHQCARFLSFVLEDSGKWEDTKK